MLNNKTPGKVDNMQWWGLRQLKQEGGAEQVQQVWLQRMLTNTIFQGAQILIHWNSFFSSFTHIRRLTKLSGRYFGILVSQCMVLSQAFYVNICVALELGSKIGLVCCKCQGRLFIPVNHCCFLLFPIFYLLLSLFICTYFCLCAAATTKCTYWRS